MSRRPSWACPEYEQRSDTICADYRRLYDARQFHLGGSIMWRNQPPTLADSSLTSSARTDAGYPIPPSLGRSPSIAR